MNYGKVVMSIRQFAGRSLTPILFLTLWPNLATILLMTSNDARLKMTKRLFKGTSGDVQRLARQAHKELRLKERAAYWAAHPEKHPTQ